MVRKLQAPTNPINMLAAAVLLVAASVTIANPPSKATSTKELVWMVEVADLRDAATLQRLSQEANVLGERQLADLLSEMSQNVDDPEVADHLESGLWDYLDIVGAAQQASQGGIASPPSNDDCATPTVISAVPYVNTVTAFDASDDTNANPSCDSSSNTLGANNGVWYTYTPAANCTAHFSEGTSNDTSMSVWTGASCASLTQSFCTDPESGTFAMVAGTTYYIMVSLWGTGTPTGNYTLAFDCTTAAPANDSCAGATAISTVPFMGATSAPASTDDTNANPSCDSSSNTLGANNGAWWSFTPAVNCTAVMSELSSLDVAISIWTGTCPTPLTQAFCSDPETNVSFALTAGTPYYIMVSAWSSTNPSSGAYTLAFDCAACGDGIIQAGEACDGANVGSCPNGCSATCQCNPPVNDECSGATQVFDGSNPFSNLGATVGADPKCDTNLSADVWYYYNATCSGAATISTCGPTNTGPDTVLQIYDGCACPPTTTIGCADDTPGCGTSGFASSATVSVTSGNCYRIRLANYSSSGTTVTTVAGTLAISCAPAVCGNNTVEPGEACDGTGPLGACIHGCTPPGPGGCQCAGPANDHCPSGVSVGDGVILLNRAFATTDGVAQPNPPCDFPFGDDQIHHDVWLNYTATCTGRLYVDTCNGVGLDTRLAVYDGCQCPPAADPLSCNDDSGAPDELTDPDMDPDLCNQAGGSPFESATRNQVVAGNCYKIRVGSYSATSPHDGVEEVLIQCLDKGACCAAGGACTPGLTAAECSGSLFVGADCTPESCCINGACSMLAPECCQNEGGTPGGPGSDCDNCGNGIVDCGEQCDGGDCCTANCTYATSGTLCRASAGDCDVAESCDGLSAACPPDGYSSGNVCRPAAGVCDAPESCDGSGATCPTDQFLSGNTCRNSTGPCDPAENCDGSGADCPADMVITACVDGDGCCPAGCVFASDNDCPPIIPTVSEWGLIILTLLGLAVGCVVFKKKALELS